MVLCDRQGEDNVGEMKVMSQAWAVKLIWLQLLATTPARVVWTNQAEAEAA